MSESSTTLTADGKKGKAREMGEREEWGGGREGEGHRKSD